jgi:hypothetical protein
MGPYAIIASLLIGLLAGILSGMFGIGGGIVMVPAMRCILKISGHMAIGTSLLAVIPTAISGALIFGQKRMLKYRVGLVSGIVGSFLAILGARATQYFGSGQLMMIFSVVAALVASRFIIWNKKKREGGTWKRGRSIWELPLAIAIGIIAGFASGFLGIGGGIILVPAYVFLMGLGMHEALGTSLITIPIYAISGSVEHYLLGHVDLVLFALIAVGSVIGAQMGARFSVVAKERKLRILFGVFLLVASAYLGISEFLGWNA